MIFVSHNHKDKQLVEIFARRLADIFGQQSVFYDSWSIQPGDGIVEKMGAGLDQCKLFFFFVSKNSLASEMVKLEWQNALMKASAGKMRVIPVRLDDCLMPALLTQSLYIDLYGHGLEVALRQVVDIAQGRSTYSPNLVEFHNVKAVVKENDTVVQVICSAENFLEPINSFAFVFPHGSKTAVVYKGGSMARVGENPDAVMDNGSKVSIQFVSVERGLAPGFPLIVEVGGRDLQAILHEKAHERFVEIPVRREFT